MKLTEKKKKTYQLCYGFFWGISGTFFLMFLILFILYYFTPQRNLVTFSHLFSLAFLLGGAGIGVLLGNHFHFLSMLLTDFGRQSVKTSSSKRKRQRSRGLEGKKLS